MNVCRLATPAARLMSQTALVPRRFASSGSPQGNVHPGYIKIKEKYAKFQVEDGTPIHLKGGPLDRVLYYTTLIGCGVGLVMTFEYYYSAAFPKKC